MAIGIDDTHPHRVCGGIVQTSSSIKEISFIGTCLKKLSIPIGSEAKDFCDRQLKPLEDPTHSFSELRHNLIILPLGIPFSCPIVLQKFFSKSWYKIRPSPPAHIFFPVDCHISINLLEIFFQFLIQQQTR